MGWFSKVFGGHGANCNVGEIIPFGPFEWRILSKSGEEALLITEEVVDCMWYQQPMRRYDVVPWEQCSLRRYLNERFIYDNFTDDQIKCMRRMTIHNDPDPYKNDTEVDKSLDTRDTAYCLSISEAWAFFEKPSVRRAKASSCAIKAGARADKEGCCAWWLRSNLSLEEGAYVTNRGSVTSNWIDSASQSGIGVRPALTISLKDYKALGVKGT